MHETCGIACARISFTPEEKRLYSQLKEEVFRTLGEIEETADGYAFALGSRAGLLAALAEWIPLEHKCCPFLTATVRVRPGGEVRLELTGPAEIKGFLLEELELETVS